MSFIDWSDPDEMFGLLVDYVTDEAAASHDDPDRSRFLRQLSRELGALAAHDFANTDRIELPLRAIIDALPREFAGDPVTEHLEACVEELHRIATAHRATEASGS